MNRNRFRAAVGAAAIATLLASGTGPATAATATAGDHGSSAAHGSDRGDAKGKGNQKGKGAKDRGDKHKGDKDKGDKAVRKLAKAIDKQDARLAKLLDRGRKLSDTLRAEVGSNIAADRAALAELTTVDAVRDLDPENYEQVIASLRKVERLTAEVATPDAAVSAAAAAAVEQLLAISARSPKADVRAAKDLVRALEELVEAALAGADDPTEDPADDPTDDPADDPTDTGV